MILIIGLGNPGSRYEKTRHNMGFLIVDKLMSELKAAEPRMVCQSMVAATRFEGHELLLAKPMTYMNRSGYAVRELQERFVSEMSEMIIIHDDVDLSLGSIRIKQGGGDGGHKGIRSIINRLEFSDFLRVRVGIGHPLDDMETSDYVLAPLESDLWDETRGVIEKGSMAVQTVITHGSTHAMNQYNRREKSENI